jgi:hypothetical protein
MDVADARSGFDNLIGTGSLFQGCQQAWALGISLESSSDMLKEPRQVHAAAILSGQAVATGPLAEGRNLRQGIV